MDGNLMRGYRAGMRRSGAIIVWVVIAVIVVIYDTFFAAVVLHSADHLATGGIMVGLTVAFAGAVALYFAPTLVARRRGVRNHQQVFVVNLLTGWSLIGWVIALTMAFAPVNRQSLVRS